MLREVRVKNGVVRGLPAADPRITSFKGIPFAAPPTGKNRWRAPQSAADWDGVLEAFQFGPIAMQATPGVNKDNIYDFEWHVDPNVPMSEDCLYLNVWTPAISANEKLPVLSGTLAADYRLATRLKWNLTVNGFPAEALWW